MLSHKKNIKILLIHSNKDNHHHQHRHHHHLQIIIKMVQLTMDLKKMQSMVD